LVSFDSPSSGTTLAWPPAGRRAFARQRNSEVAMLMNVMRSLFAAIGRNRTDLTLKQRLIAVHIRSASL
jgi:hypothetical protein